MDWILWILGLLKCLKIQARAFASFPWNRFIFILSVVMEEVTPQQCPLNVIHIRVLQGHCSIYNMDAGKYLLYISIPGSYSVPGIYFSPINPSKYLTSANTTTEEISSFLRGFCLFETRVLPTLTWPRFDTILFL